jgi:anhydro-N-acetylmuramic acid kinase
MAKFSSNLGQIYVMIQGNEMGEIRVLGVMSGTSCDGLDLAWIEANSSSWQVKLTESQAIDYPWYLQNELRSLGELSPDVPSELVAAIDLEQRWTAWVAAEIQRACREKVGRERDATSLVGFSGQTWYHQPDGRGTRAIGDCAALSMALGLPVVGDYRSADVAAGGRGAPLVPLFDAFTFPDHAACLNLGGIANLSAGKVAGQRIAWDVCACNLLLNRQAARLGLPYDRGGALAAAANADTQTRSALDAWPYLKLEPPKALAAEDFEALHHLLDALPPEVALSTATAHIGAAIARDLQSAAEKPGRVLVTGGGAWNEALLAAIEIGLNAQTQGWVIDRPTADWVDGKEAAAFAWLALRTACGQTTSFASATGAQRDVHGGKLYGNFAAQSF